MTAWLTDLLDGRIDLLWRLPDGSFDSCADAGFPDGQEPRGLLAGSFDPLHEGHRRLRSISETVIGGPVAFELSVSNVDKPPLSQDALIPRLEQFETPVLLTNAPTFVRKAEYIGPVTFVVGADTAQRILDPRYCVPPDESVATVTRTIRDCGCRFLVAGRLTHGHFLTKTSLPLEPDYADLFEELPVDTFRCDISSTDLREKK